MFLKNYPQVPNVHKYISTVHKNMVQEMAVFAMTSNGYINRNKIISILP